MLISEHNQIKTESVNQALRVLKMKGLDFVAKKDEKLQGYNIVKENEKILIRYGEPCDFFRALLHISQNGVIPVNQNRICRTLGYMIDVARNAVPKISTLKRLVSYLAVLGYNRLYLYLEDLFEVKGEPFFGYLRGRYTEEELQEFDEYCAGFGIELVPCIQTLAHLNAIFKWGEYQKCLDVADILLIDNERTYQLIQNVFKAVARVFRSKMVHIGMDEAHLVGRGKYLDINGYKPGYEIMSKHIKKVVELAKPFGFELMIWSDMYFRLAFNGEYYSLDDLPEDIKAQIPKNITLTYWDYSVRDGKMLSHMMEEHVKTGNSVMFAGGAIKWNGWNPSTKYSLLAAKAALDACRKFKVEDIMLTAWADDGAEASLFSTLPIMVYYSGRCYNTNNYSETNIDLVLKNIFSLSLKDFYSADMDFVDKEEIKTNECLGKIPKILLYNDPLSGVYDGIIERYAIDKEIKKCTSRLTRVKNNAPEEFRYIFKNLENLCKVLQRKAKLGIDIRKAYQTNDMRRLRQIAETKIPALIRCLKVFERGFYQQWMLENKDNGYQTHDLRIGGLMKRLLTVKALLEDFVAGRINEIYELCDEILLIDGEDALNMLLWKDWKYIHSVYVV